MYSEPHPIGHPAGVHYGTLDAFAHHYQPGVVTINGVDPTDRSQWQGLVGHPDLRQGGQATIAAETGDPQTDRDAVHIARGIIEMGRNPWMKPGLPANEQPRLPQERYNQAANHMRTKVLNLPQEGPMQVAASVAVSGDMTNPKLSSWTVVALGELQQPGGVGATQDYNPVVDGPNPDGTNFGDNAGNSPEQEVALQTWVNTAVDLLNRGEPQEAVLAQLAHDGCPNPQEVIQRALQQPEGAPVSDEIGQDPFEAPAPSDAPTGQMQGLSQQPAVATPTAATLWKTADLFDFDAEKTPEDLMDQSEGKETPENLFIIDDKSEADNHVAPVEFKDEVPVLETTDVHSSRVRIAGTTLTGREVERYEDMWGEGVVKIALDADPNDPTSVGGTMNVHPSVVEPIAGNAPKHPVSEIQSFIDSMPKVEPTRPHIEARIANLKVLTTAVRQNISKVGFSDQQKLDQMRSDAEAEIALLREVLGNFEEDYEQAYLANAPKYALNAFNLGDVQTPEWAGYPKEAGAIWATENFITQVDDDSSFVAAAAHYASSQGMNGTQFQEFLAGAETQRRKVRTDEFTATEPETTDADGPAEQLFV
jgi:hypothetical protein